MTELTKTQMAILEVEGSWWRHAGAKETVIRDRLGISSVRYYQLLNELLDDPAALEHAPLVVNRLRRLREQRQRARGAKAVGW
jgi:hypothetical protein